MSTTSSDMIKTDNSIDILDSPSELLKKKDLSLDEALIVMRHCEQMIQTVAANRLDPPVRKDAKIDGASFGTPSVIIGGVASFPAIIINIEAFGSPIAIIFNTIVAMGAIGTAISFRVDKYKGVDDGWFFRGKRRRKFNEYEQEFETNTRLYELKEQEYLKTVKKVAKPAQRAIDVINANLEDEVIVYDGAKGREGFVTRPRYLEPQDKWESLAIRLPNSQSFGQKRELSSNINKSLSVMEKKEITP